MHVCNDRGRRARMRMDVRVGPEVVPCEMRVLMKVENVCVHV